MSSAIQREIKMLVDQALKSSETKSLRFTRVSVRSSQKGLEVSIKIYLEHPMRLSSIYDLARSVAGKYGVAISEVLIYPPHSRAIRLSFVIKS